MSPLNLPPPAVPEPDAVHPQPTPVTAEVAQAVIQGERAVILTLHTVVGPVTVFLPAPSAIALADMLRNAGGGLTIPTLQPPGGPHVDPGR